MTLLHGSPKRLIDWSHCPAICSRPGYLSGKPALRDDPRVPPETIIDNIDYAETDDMEAAAAEVIENFSLRTTLHDVLAIYAYAKDYRARHPG